MILTRTPPRIYICFLGISSPVDPQIFIVLHDTLCSLKTLSSQMKHRPLVDEVDKAEFFPFCILPRCEVKSNLRVKGDVVMYGSGS